MFFAFLVCAACTTLAPPSETAEARGGTDVMADYHAARAEAGRNADAHVCLALWCEGHGMPAERLKHLAIAVLTDPSHARARGLMGMVAFRGRWQSPEAVSAGLASDGTYAATLGTYNGRRARMGDSADAHWKLALWCEQQGLRPEATAHLTRVVQLDPGREAAWKRLGYRRQGRRRVTENQLAAEKAEAISQKEADRRWSPLLNRWRRWIGDASKGVELVEALSTVNDPRAVPSVWATLGCGKASHQEAAVQVLGQIDSPDATRALTLLALEGNSPRVRAGAAQVLRLRDPRDVASLLVALLRDPQLDPDPILYHYQLRPFAWDAVDAPGLVMVSGPRYSVIRSYTLPETLLQLGRSDSSAPWNVNAYANRATARRQRQVSDLAALIDQILRESEEYIAFARQHVREVDRSNARVIRTLGAATRRDLGEDKEAWRKWLTEERGYAYDAPPARPRQDLTLDDDKPTYYTDVPTTSCFAAGTPVRTLAGPRPIESVAIGDQVLTQDPHSGALSFRPVIAALHNKPDKVWTIKLGGERIKATGIHRFWKPGLGWVMARDLKAGDLVRSLGGVATVKAVEPAGIEPVFNLKVMQAESFFVGSRGLLVHDNSEVRPVLDPFDGVAEPTGSYPPAPPPRTGP